MTVLDHIPKDVEKAVAFHFRGFQTEAVYAAEKSTTSRSDAWSAVQTVACGRLSRLRKCHTKDYWVWVEVDE